MSLQKLKWFLFFFLLKKLHCLNSTYLTPDWENVIVSYNIYSITLKEVSHRAKY